MFRLFQNRGVCPWVQSDFKAFLWPPFRTVILGSPLTFGIGGNRGLGGCGSFGCSGSRA